MLLAADGLTAEGIAAAEPADGPDGPSLAPPLRGDDPALPGDFRVPASGGGKFPRG